MDILLQAVDLVFTPTVLLTILLSGMFGLFVGAIPGLTATMAVALLVPVTFFMDPLPAIASIVTATAMAIFSGDIPGALLRIPGTPSSAAYVEDAYALTKQGKSRYCLGANLSFSVAGGLFGCAMLVLFAPMLAQVALRFGSYEYFWLSLLGLSCAVFISPSSLVKGLISLLIGLFIANVGLDIMTGHPRFTFGSADLTGGVSFIPAMIGLFAVSEVIRGMSVVGGLPRLPPQSGSVFRKVPGLFKRYWKNYIQGSVLGVFIGALPGAGSDIAAWISYAVSKKISKQSEKFGKGHIEGIISSTSANNAGLSGAWIPALVFGIPGDSITAIAIGVLYMKGLNPGPMIFIQQPETINAIFIIFLLANLLLLPLGYLAIVSASKVLAVPREILMPLVLMFSIVGAFAINNSVFDVGVMLVIGILAYVLEENDFPLAPIILGIVLGPILERNFMSSMLKSSGDLMSFFERPIAAGLGVATIALWFLPLLIKIWMRHALRNKPQAA